MSVAAPRTPLARRSWSTGRLRASPELVTALGAVLIAVFAAVTAARVTGIVLDEAVYRLAANRYADTFLATLQDDNTSRGAARLYSIVLSPIFRIFDGDSGVRVARCLGAVLFCATAAPVWLLARRAGATKWGAAAAAIGSIAVPWLTLSTVLFSESLAYLLFACAALAMVRALDAPSAGRELVAVGALLALTFTRVQFVVLGVVWVAWVAATAIRSRTWPWRRFPITTAATLLAVPVAIKLWTDLSGPYGKINDRPSVPGSFGLAAMWEVQMLALGVGIIPMVLAVSWYRVSLARAADAATRRYALITVTLLAVLMAATLWAQGGWLESRSEERYFIYAVPLIWVAAAAALARGVVASRTLLFGGAAIAALVAVTPNPIPLVGERFVLGPVGELLAAQAPKTANTLTDAFGIPGLVSAADLVALGVLVVAVVAAALWARRRHTAALAVAAVVQVGFVAFAFAGVHGKIAPVGGLTAGSPSSELAWAADAADGERMLLADQQMTDREGRQRRLTFWNARLIRLLRLPQLGHPLPVYPVETLPADQARVGSDLGLVGRRGAKLAVQDPASPLWQLDARRIALSPTGGEELVDLAATGRLRWLAEGLDIDGHISRELELTAKPGTRVTVQVDPAGTNQPSAVRVSFGRETRTLQVEAQPVRTTFDLCARTAPARGEVELVTAVDLGGGRPSGGILRRVEVTRCP